jgi:hypothetical protein
MRALVLVVAVLLAGGCRDPLPPAAPSDLAGSGDLAAPIDCRTLSDCLGCCSATLQSGALAFNAALEQCACQAATCKSACRQTACGASLGVDSACRACIDGTVGDGGACTEPLAECVETGGACGAYRSCIDRC